MVIETWESDKGGEEIHHFIDGTNTYLFGINKKLLGNRLYQHIKGLVALRLEEINDQRRNNSE